MNKHVDNINTVHFAVSLLDGKGVESLRNLTPLVCNGVNHDDLSPRFPSVIPISRKMHSVSKHKHYHQHQPMENDFLPAPHTVPDPTPIGPSGVKTVSSLTLSSTLLASDISQIEAFYKLCSPILLPKHKQFSPELAPSLPERTAATAPPTSTIESRACKTKGRHGKQQIAKWNRRFEELVQFREQHDHCLVPMHNHPNIALSNWVKRQRNQYRLKLSGLHSTLLDGRQKALEDLGFVWDPRTTLWDERYEELRLFCSENGHTSVPKSYRKNPSLARWVKCQRRHYKLMKAERLSCMTIERVRLLKELRFDFSPRS